MKYFVITSSDGDISIDCLSKTELEQRLNEQYYGDAIFFNANDSSNELTDPNYWSGKVLIIKGEIVSPQPIKIVEKFEIT